MTTRSKDLNAEKELLVKAKAGDADAFVALLDGTPKKALAGLRRSLGAHDDEAEDALQEALICAWRFKGKFKGESSFSSWFFRIVVNCGTMLARKNKFWWQPTGFLEPDDEKAPIVDPRKHYSDYEAFEKRELILKAINKIPASYSDVWKLRILHDLTNEEVAEVLGLTVPAVKSRYSRAKWMLQKILRRELR